MGISRKRFINSLLALGGIGGLSSILYPLANYLIPPKIAEAKVNSIKAGKASAFPADSAKILKFGREPVILIKTVEGEYKALSAVCTHLDCIVQYRKDTKQIWCACHNGIYDLRGINISGPPPRPLEEFKVKIIKDEIVITKAG